jgi:hypothetical protein
MMIFYYLNFLLHAHNRKQEGRLTHLNFLFFIWFLVGFMVFNATFNNIYDLRHVTSPIMEVKRYIVSYILYKMIEFR